MKDDAALIKKGERGALSSRGRYRVCALIGRSGQPVMNADGNSDIESSPLSGPVTEDGIEVYVEIYRLLNRNAGWTLEVVDHEGGSTVWETAFESDQQAHQLFLLALQLEGIRSFAEG